MLPLIEELGEGKIDVVGRWRIVETMCLSEGPASPLWATAPSALEAFTAVDKSDEMWLKGLVAVYSSDGALEEPMRIWRMALACRAKILDGL